MLANKLDSQVKERAQKMTRAAESEPQLALDLALCIRDCMCGCVGVGVPHICGCVCICVCVCLWTKFMASHCDIWAHILRQLCSQLATLTEAALACPAPPLPRPRRAWWHFKVARCLNILALPLMGLNEHPLPLALRTQKNLMKSLKRIEWQRQIKAE